MSNFFNAIGVADMEKVHSAMIAWILDDKNDSNKSGANTGSLFSTFDLTTRSHLLCDIFGEPRKKFVSIETFVEWNDIDILILTKDQNGLEERWVIENKLKSPEHVSNVKGNTPIWQTQKYTKTITNTFGDKGNHYLLLSLTGNSAKSPNGNWIAKKYEDLRNILGNYIPVDTRCSFVNKYTKVGNYINSYPLFFCLVFSLTKASTYILCIYEQLNKARFINFSATKFASVLDFL